MRIHAERRAFPFNIPISTEHNALPVLLAQQIARQSVQGSGQFAFIIGGSWGLDGAVKARADLKLSMSRMTFPHQLARVMLLEQIYRACAINNHTKYHK